jgi:hypothetical protein
MLHQRKGEVAAAAALHPLVDPEHGERFQASCVLQRASNTPRVKTAEGGSFDFVEKNITTGTRPSRRSWRRAAERGYARFLSKRERAKAPALHDVERLEHSGHQNRLHHLCILQNPLKQEAKSQADVQHHLAMLVRFRFHAREVESSKNIDQWYGPDYCYFKIKSNDGNLYILRFDEVVRSGS